MTTKAATASTTSELNTTSWVYVQPEEKRWDEIPGASISVDCLIGMRNGLMKLHDQPPFKGTALGIMLYRAALDCDHAARLMKVFNESSSVTLKYNVIIKDKTKKNGKKRRSK